MEITRIGADAFKIRITAGELSEAGIQDPTAGKPKKEMKLLLDQVLLRIEQNYRKVYQPQEAVTEFFPDRKGGCYLYLNAFRDEKEKSEERMECFYFPNRQQLERYLALEGSAACRIYRMGEGYYLSAEQKDQRLLEFSDEIRFDPKEWALFLEYAEMVTIKKSAGDS